MARPVELPGWSPAASYYLITSHTAGVTYVRREARSDQDSIRAAEGASGLIRNAGVKEAMLSQTVCAAYIHLLEAQDIQSTTLSWRFGLD
eukprot:1161458-Pelagomonas_calceolata.AAC.2